MQFKIGNTVIPLVNGSCLPLKKLHSEILSHLGSFSKKMDERHFLGGVVITYFLIIVVHQWHLFILSKKIFFLFLGRKLVSFFFCKCH